MYRRKKNINIIIRYLLATAGAVLMIFPFLFMVSNAFKDNVLVIEYPTT